MLGFLKRVTACALACAALAVSGCASRSDAAREPDTIISITRTDGATMNPLFAQTAQDGLVYAQLLYESLSYIGADYLPHPRLATSWRHSADGRTWIVNLRHGVRWSDGQPLTSKDVVFSYDALTDPKTAAIEASDFTYLKRVVAEGPYRVRFELTHPSAVFTLVVLGVEAPILPEHVLGKVPHERLRATDFGEHPVGSGPYMLQRWLHDSETVFVRNPYAWRRPKIGRIDVRTIFNESSTADAMANGSADLYDDIGSTVYQNLKRIAPGVRLMTFDSVLIDVTTPNLRRPGLDDVNVRRAMMYGQDRASVIKGFFGNLVPLPDGLVPNGLTHWYTPNVTKYPYDPQRARRILDAAGWHPAADGIRRRGKTRLSFEILLNQGSVILTAAMLSFIADMKAIGIEVNLRQLDFPSILSRQLRGNFDLVAEGIGGSVDPDLTGYLATESIPPNGANYGAFSDPVIDRELKAAIVELNDPKRQAIYRAMQREIADQVPIFWDYGRFAGLAHSARLHLDPKTTLQQPLLYYNVEDWTVTP
jgi:peptide/nickel transport system substrate-binding protein